MLAGIMFFLGVVSLLLAPFSAGISIFTAAAFFFIWYLLRRGKK